MKNMNRQLLALAFCIMTGLFSCKKEENALLGPDPSLVTFEVNVPFNTRQTDQIRVVGSYKDSPWAADKSPFILKYKEKGVFQGKLPVGSLPADTTFYFKFVRGTSWDYEERELSAAGVCSPVANRSLPTTDAGGKTFTYTVNVWRDLTPQCN